MATRANKAVPGRAAQGTASHARNSQQGVMTDGYIQAQMIEDLRKYQTELEIQNTALRYSQIAAEGASERFITVFSSVPLSLMMIDEMGQILESNTMALRLFRPHENDRPLHFLLPLVLHKDNDRVAHAIADAKVESSSITTEVSFHSGSDHAFVGDLHIARIDNTQNELAQFICAVVNQDPLLAQRRALLESAQALQQRNEELFLSEKRLAAVINSSLDAIICVDDNLHVTVFNPAAATLFDCAQEQASGSALNRFLPAVGHIPGFEQLSQPSAPGSVSGSVFLGETTALTATGVTFPVEVSASREHQPRGDLITLFARDLTARNKAQTQKDALEAQLRQSQKMQAMGTMAGGIAHDFNNLLSAILGNAELARQDSAPNSVTSVSLHEIDKAGRRARDLVRQILTFSRNDPPKRVPVALADVVIETARLLKTSLPPPMSLELKLSPDVPPVLADATQVEQAVLNLCTNAMQAIGNRKGVIHIALTTERPDAAHCARLGLQPGTYAAVRVRDTGDGIAPDVLQRIFEPFFTTKQVGQGTGLGLAVVHGIMRSHLGTVDVQSSVGEGSSFTLFFPAANRHVEMPMAELPSRPPPRGARQHVMYVDDDQALVFLIHRVLTRQGLKVSTFTDPHAAEAALRAKPKDFDLLVTDYNMPGYSGLDLLRQARAIRPQLPVVLASGYVTAEIERDALEAGASALLHKPNDVNEFCEVVQRLLAQAKA